MANYRLPAEWEPQSAVQLTWPHSQTDWAPMLDEVLTVYNNIAREISLREPLLIVCPTAVPDAFPSASAAVPDAFPSGSAAVPAVFPAGPVIHFPCPTNDTWARDHGFITLTGSQNCKLLDFCFNGWGEKFPAELDNAINRRLHDAGILQGQYVPHLDFVLEGGSIESDGQGTIFTTSQCLLAPHRNQPLTRGQIEQRLKDYLGADRVLWIDHGQLAGDDTDGHIDTLVRICPDDTLLYLSCDDPSDEHYNELHLMEEQLRTFRTIEGKPYRLLPLPLPRPIYDATAASPAGLSRLPATHANFLVINGAVLVPTYGQPDIDQQAMTIIGQAFPDRDIVPIDCLPLIRQHGSLHCCTMQFPLGVIRTC